MENILPPGDERDGEIAADDRRHELGCPAVAGAPEFCTCDDEAEPEESAASMRRVWRVWKFRADDPQGYETAKDLNLEPFAVDDGWIYWRALTLSEGGLLDA